MISLNNHIIFNSKMYVITVEDNETQTQTIIDVVETYEILVKYMELFVERNPEFKKELDTIPQNPQLGYTVPILKSNVYYVCIQRYEFTTEPNW